MTFGTAEVVVLCLAVAIVGMASHRNTAVDLRTVLSPGFWLLIVAVAAVLYLGYLALAFGLGLLAPPLRPWALLALVVTPLAAWGVSTYVRSRESAASRARWRDGAMVLPALALFFTAASFIGDVIAQYAGGHPVVNATAAAVVAYAGAMGLGWWRERRRDARLRKAAFAPLLERWHVEFNTDVFPNRFNVSIERDGVPLELEVAYQPAVDTTSLDVTVHVRVRDAAAREFVARVPVVLESPAGPDAERYEVNVGTQTCGNGRWDLRVDASAQLPPAKVVAFVDGTLDAAVLAARKARSSDTPAPGSSSA